MKKVKFLAAAFAALLCATSCSDEMDTEKTTAPQPQSGYLCSYTNLIVSADNIASERVEVASGDLRVINANPELSYTIEHDGQGYFLVTHVNGSQSTRHFDEVKISDGVKTETMKVTVDPVRAISRAYTSDMDPYQNKAIEVLGNGIDYLGSIGERKMAVVDFDRFVDDGYRKELSRALSINTNIRGNNTYLAKGNTLTEITKVVEKKMGMNVKFPVKCMNVSAGFDKTHFEQTKTSEAREYLFASVNVVNFEANVDLDQLINEATKVAKKTGDDFEPDGTTFACLMTPSANNILNNKRRIGQAENISVRDRAINAIKKLGTHVVTEAQFGAYAQLSYDKQETMSSDDIKDYLGVELKLDGNSTTTGEKSDKSETKDTDGTKTAIYKTVLNKYTPSLSFTNSQQTNNGELSKSVDSHQYICTKGGITVGNPDHLESWSCGSVDKMVPLTYATASTMRSLDQGAYDTNESLVPLYLFCTDADLRDEIKRLLTPDANGVLQYYNEVLAEDEPIAQSTDEMVVADVKLVSFSTTDLNANIYTPLTMKDAKGNTHTYYPMVMNAECTVPSGEAGKVFTLNSSCYTKVGIKNRMVCYYAIEPASTCNGITDIRLMTQGEYSSNQHTNEFRAETKEYKGGPNNNITITEGPRTDFGHGEESEVRTCQEGERYLYVTYGTSETPNSKKIKGVAWHYGSPQSPRSGEYFCSTGGTEYSTTNDFTEAEHKAFRDYWTSSDTKCTSTFDNGAFTRYQRKTEVPITLFLKRTVWGGLQYSPLQPVYSTKSIYRDMKPVIKTVNGRPQKVLPITYPI